MLSTRDRDRVEPRLHAMVPELASEVTGQSPSFHLETTWSKKGRKELTAT